ncbi:dynein axonemal assembly factor 3 [Patagioenas fasciata]|uniref:dynein axonemal assembly factor 3 n=1 Tax=Patagioenas fasciata TaxID=372321 RepID=UPI003A98EED8
MGTGGTGGPGWDGGPGLPGDGETGGTRGGPGGTRNRENRDCAVMGTGGDTGGDRGTGMERGPPGTETPGYRVRGSPGTGVPRGEPGWRGSGWGSRSLPFPLPAPGSTGTGTRSRPFCGAGSGRDSNPGPARSPTRSPGGGSGGCGGSWGPGTRRERPWRIGSCGWGCTPGGPPRCPRPSSGAGGKAASPSCRGGGDTAPNPTLRSSRCPQSDGQEGPDPGYWGDTVTGPFVAFGLDPERRSPGKTATEISLENVTALLHELLTGTPPGEPPGETPGESPTPRDPPGDDSDPLGPRVPLPLRVRFLPLGGALRAPPRARLNPQLLVLGWRSLPELTPELGQLAAPGATLLVELPTWVPGPRPPGNPRPPPRVMTSVSPPRFAPTLRPPQLHAFRARVVALARDSGFQPWGGPGEPPAYARFRRAPPP